MSTLSAAPISVGLLRGLENSKSRSFQIFGEAAATNYYDFDLESEPLFHTLSGPQTCCPPSMDYCDSSSSSATVTPSSYKSTSPSVLVTPPQTPLGLHPTSFPAVPSPLCLGPSLCRTHPENDLEDVCLDGPCDDENNVGEDDELPELVTPKISCSPSMDYCDSISSCSTVTTSSCTSTSPSILVTPPQTPLGLHPISFPAVPSPLCLGPSLCRTHPENDLEDVCLDKSWEDENTVGKEDEFPEFITPQPSCSPSMDYCDSSSSCSTVTPSSCTSTSPSILVTPPQTPLGLHPISFPAVPSPLCLGPSLCRTHPENDLEDVCLDGSYDENDVGEDDGFLELVTPLSSSIPPPSQYLNVGGTVDDHDHERELSSARSCAMTKRVRFLC